MSPETRTSLAAPAGLVIGPMLWVIATEAGQILPYMSCDSPWHPPALLAFPSALASLAGSWLSWRASRPEISPRADGSVYPAAFPFVGRVSALAGILFAYALALQGVSALLLTGCER